MLRHRRDVYISLAAAVLGSVCQTIVPLVERQIIDNVILVPRSPLWPWLVLLIAFGRGRPLFRLRSPVPGRPGGAGCPVRPAQRHARPPAVNGLRQPQPDAYRAAGGPGQLGHDSGPGPPQLLPHHERQHPADGGLARTDDLPLALAGDSERGRGARPADRFLPDALENFPGHLGRPATRR